MEELIEQAKINIRQAIKDYKKHICEGSALDDVSESFVKSLAFDSVYAKQKLRNLFSKSPNWNPELDAIVINGTKTHHTDYEHVRSLLIELFKPALAVADDSEWLLIRQSMGLFRNPLDEWAIEQGIEAINTLAPKAYAPGKKLSRVLKALCTSLGVVDEKAGSKFQKLYAQITDEMNSGENKLKLFISINPAHFLTMSNPKKDERGESLTSCHSLNDEDYTYNNGCTGYARDETSFIVFTVDNPDNAESFNNRKTTRQIFAYTPGNGVLLQSRMYNTSGGTSGAVEESQIYREIVQKEISELEGIPNSWTTDIFINHKNTVIRDNDFGGYPDWEYKKFAANVSINTDHADDWRPIRVGSAGLCICCGSKTSIGDGLYCSSCKPEANYCECCGAHTTDELVYVHSFHGEEIGVCEECLNEYYSYCTNCGEYYNDGSFHNIDGEAVCDNCTQSAAFGYCDYCGEVHRKVNMPLIRPRSRENASRHDLIYVCDNNFCIDHYPECSSCGDTFYEADTVKAYNADGTQIILCDECAENDTLYEICPECRKLVEKRADGTCPYCG